MKRKDRNIDRFIWKEGDIEIITPIEREKEKRNSRNEDLGQINKTMPNGEGNLISILEELIERLKNDKNIYGYNEANTRLKIVNKILSILGWDYEIKPEYRLKSRIVDYAILLENDQKVLIEAKQVNEDLSNYRDLLRYTTDEQNVIMAILTNGIDWWFYLPLKEDTGWEENKFYAIDIENQDKEEITDMFVDLLSKENVEGGKARELADELYKGGKEKSKKLSDTIPKSWDRIMTERADIIDLMIEKTESLCGHRPDVEMIDKFLDDNRARFIISPVNEPGGRITGYFLGGARYKVKKWKELLVQIANYLYMNHPNEFFNKAGNVRRYKTANPFITTDRDKLNIPVKIGPGFYIESAFGAAQIEKICFEWFKIFRYPDNFLKIEKKSVEP